MKSIRHRGHRKRRDYLTSFVSFFSVFSVAFVYFLSACSLPSLEKPQCTSARDIVKRFYSFHFGNDMHPSAENLKAREQFLTRELISSLSASTGTAKDYFTATDDYPKAFRIGSCSVAADGNVTLQVLLFWRDDTKSEQKEIKVEVVKNNDNWLINKVFN